MAYYQDPATGDIVINGFEKGIADDPYSGIGDVRNLNLITVPKEASVNFATTLNSIGTFSASITSADAATDTVTYANSTGTPVAGMAVVFAGGSLPAGLSAGSQSAASDTNVYWISNINLGAQTFKCYTNPTMTSLVDITNTGTGTVASIDIAQQRHWTSDVSTPSSSVFYTIDANGRVWYQNGTTWVFTGNITRTNGHGNGLVYYQASNGTGFIFAFRNAKIDYMPAATVGTWTLNWQTLNTAAGVANSHHALVGQDNVVYYCDGAWLGSFFQKTSGTPFDPSNSATYTWASQALALPYIDISQWLVELGVTLLVAGMRNYIYPWNRIATSFNYPILCSDNFGYANYSVATPNIPKMVTVNTNTFVFMGNRGRIYITNGSQIQLYKKIPDFLSGTVEPYYTWGGVGFNKNQLYFGVLATTNAGGTNANYGGLWAIDLDTKALRLVNQLSYGSYAGLCTLFIPLTTNASGSAFYAGWDSGSSTYGIDVSSSSPYTSSQAYINSDLIPIGTYLKPSTPSQIEFKLAVPLVSGESIQLLWRQKLSDSFTAFDGGSSSSGTFSTVGDYSGYATANFQNSQWIQIQAILNSTASSPSYVRLEELRIHP